VKKYCAAFLLALSLSGAAFSENHLPGFSMSAGLGGIGYALFDIEDIQWYTIDASAAGGVSVFFDGTYFEAACDMIWGRQFSPLHPKDPASGSIALTHTGISLYGKFPFEFKKLTIYPMLGIDYHFFLSGQVQDSDGNDYGEKFKRTEKLDGDHKAWQQFDYFSIGLGFGMDFQLPKSFFIRSEFIFNYKFDSSIERERRKGAEEWGYDYTSVVFGPCVKIGLGYRFLTPGR